MARQMLGSILGIPGYILLCNILFWVDQWVCNVNVYLRLDIQVVNKLTAKLTIPHRHCNLVALQSYDYLHAQVVQYSLFHTISSLYVWNLDAMQGPQSQRTYAAAQTQGTGPQVCELPRYSCSNRAAVDVFSPIV